jgi:alkylation response protein AidB-like acyl-CoA dehydrogenase
VHPLVEEAKAFFAAHLEPRRAGAPVSVLGAAGGDEALAAGRRYLELLAPGGWAVPGWPEACGGRGASPEVAGAIAADLAGYDAPDLYPYAVGLALVGPTVLALGSGEQQRRWLPRIASGEEIWCQLFSEPDAGSDLAGLATRAERAQPDDADRWNVSGQKTWSSRAHYAARGLLLARTDPDVPKHAGITAFAIPMRQPGVDVRPLRQINGDAHFNEVFIDGAGVDDRDRIGAAGEGWRVALTTLGLERAGMGGGGSGSAGGGGGVHRDQLVEHVACHRDPTDRVTRARLVSVLTDVEVARLSGMRARAAARAGRPPGPEGSGGKLRLSATLSAIAGLAVDVQGPAGVAWPADVGDEGDEWTTVFLTAPSMSIRGGTDEIQRNIIGERVLGLPAEPRVDKDIPFRAARRSTGSARRGDENAF